MNKQELLDKPAGAISGGDEIAAGKAAQKTLAEPSIAG